jgi:hypothetical protein
VGSVRRAGVVVRHAVLGRTDEDAAANYRDLISTLENPTAMAIGGRRLRRLPVDELLRLEVALGLPVVSEAFAHVRVHGFSLVLPIRRCWSAVA